MPLDNAQLVSVIVLATIIYYSLWYHYRPLGLETIYGCTKDENEFLRVTQSARSGFTVNNRVFVYNFDRPSPSDEDATAELVVEYMKKRPFRKKIVLTARFPGSSPVEFKLADDKKFVEAPGPQAYLIREIVRIVSELPEIERLKRSAKRAQAAGHKW